MCTSPFCFRHAHSGPLGALEKLYEIRYKEKRPPHTALSQTKARGEYRYKRARRSAASAALRRLIRLSHHPLVAVAEQVGVFLLERTVVRAILSIKMLRVTPW